MSFHEQYFYVNKTDQCLYVHKSLNLKYSSYKAIMSLQETWIWLN